MGLLRSETMKHGTLVLPNDRAREFVDSLGRVDYIHLVDMNEHSMVRQYKRYIQRIDELERILRFLFEEIDKLSGADSVIKSDVGNFLCFDSVYSLDKVEETLNKLYVQFVRFRDNNVDLLAQKSATVEEKYVAEIAAVQLQHHRGLGSIIDGNSSVDDLSSDNNFFSSASQSLLGNEQNIENPSNQKRLGDFQTATMTFSNVAGVLPSSQQERFSRTLFRATRGNTYTYFEPIDDNRILDPQSGKQIKKSVFVVYFQGSKHSVLHEKINKICEAFGVSIHHWPSSYSDARNRVDYLNETIKDKERALSAYEDYFLSEVSVLLQVVRPGGSSLIEEWRLFCLKEKATYATLNLFEGSDITLRADCWFPASRENDIRRLLQRESNDTQVSAFLLSDRSIGKRSPPTYVITNSFTEAFQNFVDTYGVPRYKEANPALLTIVTFPFLFGIMYGDIGHGACIFIFGLFLCLFHRSLSSFRGEMASMLISGRYMILLMGFFGLFCGIIFNDFFAIGLDIFGTRFVVGPSSDPKEIAYVADKNFPYPFGFDPIWKGATNELFLMNSFKMKFSVIIALFQMGAGVILKASNTIYFRMPLDFFFQFIPQIIFLLSLVGYMDFLIFYKWLVGSGNKPKLISTIIDMCMFKSVLPENKMFRGQEYIQKVLVILMLASLPVMLLVKPTILWYRRRKSLKHSDDESLAGYAEDAHGSPIEDHADSIGDLFIHQMIETIEFALGTISNTASYLRLWALSLAHQQLALVFYERTILLCLKLKIGIVPKTCALFVACGLFATITFSILLCMDTLECFLHALRLHWVEFQNKFYKGDGYKFKPLHFKCILEAEQE